MTSRNRLHPTVVELQAEYGQSDLRPLDAERLQEWAARLRSAPSAEKSDIGAHLAVLASRLNRMEVQGFQETIGQLLALAATVLGDVVAAARAFAASGVDPTVVKGAAEKIGGASVRFDATKDGGPAGAAGVLGVIAGGGKKRRR